LTEEFILKLALASPAFLLALALGCGRAPSDAASSAQMVELAHRAVYEPAALTHEHFAGALRVDGDPISFAVDRDASGAVRATFRDADHVVRAVASSDGQRRVRVDDQPVRVAADGSVAAGRFADLSLAMRAALAVVPLHVACEHPDVEPRVMEVLALPHNLLRRSDPAAVTAYDLLDATRCGQSGDRLAQAAPGELLRRSKLVVAAPPAAVRAAIAGAR
jgi:hypothetical protein